MRALCRSAKLLYTLHRSHRWRGGCPGARAQALGGAVKLHLEHGVTLSQHVDALLLQRTHVLDARTTGAITAAYPVAILGSASWLHLDGFLDF